MLAIDQMADAGLVGALAELEGVPAVACTPRGPLRSQGRAARQVDDIVRCVAVRACPLRQPIQLRQVGVEEPPARLLVMADVPAEEELTARLAIEEVEDTCAAR